MFERENLMLKRAFIFFAATMTVLQVFNCSSTPDCVTNKTKCEGNSARICNSQGHWIDFQNCDETAKLSGGDWVCCALPGEDSDVTCLPKDQCGN